MSYQYKKSEDFRAGVYIFAGYACFSPFGVYITRLITKESVFNLVSFSISMLICLCGYLLIAHAYYIIWKKDKRNA
jgi:uncharacterized membrane protein YfcA